MFTVICAKNNNNFLITSMVWGKDIEKVVSKCNSITHRKELCTKSILDAKNSRSCCKHENVATR